MNETEKPVKPLSERIRIEQAAAINRMGFTYKVGTMDRSATWEASAITLGFLAELAEEQAEIKAMLQARKDT